MTLAPLYDVMAGYVARGEIPQLVTAVGLGIRRHPKRDTEAILLTQRAWESPDPPPVCVDFLAAAYDSLTPA